MIRLLISLSLLCIHCSISGFASSGGSNPVDSLLTILPGLEKEERIEALLYLARRAPFDEQEGYLQEAEQLAAPSSLLAGRMHKEWAIFHVIRHHHTACLDQLEQARKIFEHLKAQKELAYLYHMYVELYTTAFDHITARKYGNMALDIALDVGEDELIGYSYHALSHTVPYQNPEREYIHPAISYLKKSNSKFLSHAYNNLGYRYYKTGVLDSSLIYFNLALKLKEEKKDPTVSNTLGNLAELYLSMGLNQEALETSEQVLSILAKTKDLENLLTAYLIQVEALIELDSLDRALQAMAKADTIISQFNLPIYELRIQFFQVKKKLAFALNNSADYYTFDQEFMRLSDTLAVKKDSVFIHQLKAQQELHGTEAKLQMLDRELEYQVWLNWGLGALILLGITIFLLIFRNQRIVNKFEQKRLQLLDQKRKVDQLEIQNLKQRQILHQEENRQVEERLDYRKRQLSSSLIMASQKNELLKGILEELENGIKSQNGESKVLLEKLKKRIEYQLAADEDWDKLKLHFEEIHPEFFQKLTDRFPHISANDRRLCAFIRMQMTNKEIARILGVNAASVLKNRYRLRKKFDLAKEEDLTNFILNF
ncbi:MAG: tetratricopeptide repeat protein [Saprospiraceae bacterium]|nr:tetratricopeptide repeat protein [Saprospiraceae bacterium]